MGNGVDVSIVFDLFLECVLGICVFTESDREWFLDNPMGIWLSLDVMGCVL